MGGFEPRQAWALPWKSSDQLWLLLIWKLGCDIAAPLCVSPALVTWQLWNHQCYRSSPGFDTCSVLMSRMNQTNVLLDAIPFPTCDHCYTNVWNFPYIPGPRACTVTAPVTHYSITCTTGEEEIYSETVPANTTSFDLTVVAGAQYTITVSALSNGRESQNNPQHNFGMLSAFLNVLMDTSSSKMSCFLFVVNYRIYTPSWKKKR